MFLSRAEVSAVSCNLVLLRISAVMITKIELKLSEKNKTSYLRFKVCVWFFSKALASTAQKQAGEMTGKCLPHIYILSTKTRFKPS